MVNQPRYKTHKVNYAYKIADFNGRTGTFTFANGQQTDAAKVSSRFPNPLQRCIGGYYVSYADGHVGWEPADATFPAGTPIG